MSTLKILTRKACTWLQYTNIIQHVKNIRLYSELRNIGIMAHIDAGKTTTTERMLYYSGYINQMGEIDAGTTVMDYLPTEIERGITVQSAAISFKWKNTAINLIDTPGHVDFTIEVERALRVLDGAVAIFDASRGVEAQSRTVWKQSDRHKVPRIAFLNKMDKPASNFNKSVRSIQNDLGASTLLLQIPLKNKEGLFCGVINLINMTEVVWDLQFKRSNSKGRPFVTNNLTPKDDHWELMLRARTSIIEQLSELYDDMATEWLEGKNAENPSKISSKILQYYIRKATLERKCIPILCGSSFENVGVQLLLDAVVDYLPNPSDIKHKSLKIYNGSLCAMAFKVIYDRKFGFLVFVRVYSGCLTNKMNIYNPTKSRIEKVTKLMKVFANEYIECQSIEAGEIGLVSGTKITSTGDTLVESLEAFQNAQNKNKDTDSSVLLAEVPIPEPVYFCMVEVSSILQEKALSLALEIISREDPSLRVKEMDSGSVMISELHMEVVTQRIRKEFKVDAYIGPLNIAYKESPTNQVTHTETFSKTVLGKLHEVMLQIILLPTHKYDCGINMENIKTQFSYSAAGDVKLHSVKVGIIQACQQGVIMNYPVSGAEFKIKTCKVSSGCPQSLICSFSRRMAETLLDKSGCELIEPVMKIEITTEDETKMHSVLNELNKRKATIVKIEASESNKTVYAEAPLALMKGFSTKLRSVTSGGVDLSIEVAGYRATSQERLTQVQNQTSGYQK